MILYGITLVPLPEELWAADPGILTPFYANDTDFGRSERKSAHLLKILVDRVWDWWYFPEPSKSLFIADSPDQEEAAKRYFVAEGFVS